MCLTEFIHFVCLHSEQCSGLQQLATKYAIYQLVPVLFSMTGCRQSLTSLDPSLYKVQ